MAEAMKKPVGGAYGVFLSENREEFQKQLKGQPVSAVTKLAATKWKALSEKEKAPFEKTYHEKMGKFKAYKESDDYVAPVKKEKKGKEGKKVKDKDAPKRPAGGAYGVFFQEKREAFTKQAAASGDTSFGAGAKLASAAWKEVSDKEKAKYEQRYQALKAKYDKDMAAYKASKAEADGADEEADEADEAEGEGEADAAPLPAPAKGGKRKADSPKAAKATAGLKKKAKNAGA